MEGQDDKATLILMSRSDRALGSSLCAVILHMCLAPQTQITTLRMGGLGKVISKVPLSSSVM